MNLRFLQGSPAAEFGEEALRFESSIQGLLAHRNLSIIDLETAGLRAFKHGNPYGVEPGMEALNPLVGRVVIGGAINHAPAGPWNKAVFGVNEDECPEETILRRLIDRMDCCYNAGGEVGGHNSLGYDFPFIRWRADLLEVPLPTWFKEATTRWRMDRVFDTLRIFETGQFVQSGISLSDLPDMWGRPFVSFGADFGEQWSKKELREALIAYNIWNLRDTAALLAFQTDDHNPAFADFRTDAPQSELWSLSAGFEPFNCSTKLRLNGTGEVGCALWVVSPRAGLLEEGPSRRKGWPDKWKDETKRNYVRSSGRHDPKAVRIVGLVMSTGADCSVVFEPDDEVAAIEKALTLLKSTAATGVPIYIEGQAQFNRLLRLRLSKYAGIVPQWYRQLPLTELPEATILNAWAASRLGFSGSITEIPEVSSLHESKQVLDHISNVACAFSEFATENRILCETRRRWN